MPRRSLVHPHFGLGWRLAGAVIVAVLASTFVSPGSAAAVAPPSVFSVSPSYGPSSGATQVAVTGVGLTNGTFVTSVTFGGIPASFTVLNDGLLYAYSPAHIPATVDILVTTFWGTSFPTFNDHFTYTGFGGYPGYLFVNGVSPNFGPSYGGTMVTVTGSGFLGALGVTFGGVAASGFAVYSDNQLVVTSPPHFAGAVDVVVFNGITSSPVTFADRFSYGGGLAVTGISPSSGPVSGGTSVTVIGSGFTGATAVTFGGSAAFAPTAFSDNQLVVTAPPHSAGPVDVRVWAGGASSLPTAADVYVYVGRPVVTAVSPTGGSTSGGTVVTVSGSGFTGASGVTFGGAAGTNLSVASDTRLTVNAPAHAEGNVDVVVVVGGSSSPTATADLFTYLSATPNPPARFVGNVTISGQPAPAGTAVEIHIGSSVCGTTTTFMSGGDARYVVDSPPGDSSHPGCGSDGAAVAIFVAGNQAPQGGVWHNFQLNVVDLSLFAPPPATPVATPTPARTGPAPNPPNAGSGFFAATATDSGTFALVVLGAASLLAGAGLLGSGRRRTLTTPQLTPAPARAVTVEARTRADDAVSEESVASGSGGGWRGLVVLGAIALAAVALSARGRR
jgi:large repetitive protein